MIILATIIILFILIVLFHALRIPHLDISPGSARSDKLSVLEEWFELLYENGKFNGTVLLSKQGKVIFSKSYGLNGTESPTKLTEHSSFNLASVSKQFTAMGIVILKEQSKLNYDDKLTDYIPELAFYEKITIKNLLHHTSGLPDYMKLAGKYRNNKSLFTASELIDLYQKNRPKLNFSPGSRFQYSNTGYVLLASIIERVSGISFQKFMQSNIFEPLHMKDTQVFNLLSDEEPINRVYGFKNKYWLFGGKKVKKDLNYFDGIAGDGGIYSSSYDLNIWHESLEKGTLISKESYKDAYLPAQLSNKTESNYGFGWFINSDNSVEHAGGWQGFTSFIFRNLENGDLIVILDNSSNALRVNSIGFRFNSIGINLKQFIRDF